jgi:hypothetical protein
VAILQQTQAKVICFDRVMPKLYVVDAFLKAARRLSIPSIALPHGVYLYTNEATKPKATDERRLAKFNRFDAVIVTNELRKRLLVDAGVADGKILVLGSARYCDEWLTQNRRILPGVFTDRRQVSDNLKVVLMPSKPQCRMDVDKLFSTCRVLASLEGVEAMIKPHTRIRTQQQVFDNIPLPDVSEYLTAELCEWADVLINVGSSVITEALMQDKPALYLKYLHPNTTLFEELGACWTLQDEEDLKNAMSRLREDKRYMPYRKESVAQFIKEIVYGGSHDRDVLGRYTQFIINCGDERLPVDAKAVTTH